MQTAHSFYPRGAMLAWVLAVALCPSVSVSVRHKSSVLSKRIKTDRAGFWHGGFFRPIVHGIVRKFRYLEQWRSQEFSTGVRQSVAFLSVHSRSEARLSLIDKNIGTSAGFYT